MNLRNLLPLALLTLNLAGCAQVVTKNYEGQKGGTVKYTNELFFKEKNRAKAIELANEYCSPARARITAENNMSEFTGNVSSYSKTSGNVTRSDSNQSKAENTYIHFKCGSKNRA